MANINTAIDIDNNILQELETADKYHEKIESEMNSILKESDCVLGKAESQLNEIINNDTFKQIENDIENSSESSCALSIEVSRDLFKEFDNEHNISAILHPPSDNIDNILSIKLPDVFAEVNNSQELTANKLIENEADATNKNNEILGSSLEITITNDAGDDIENDELETTLLNNSPTFEGCSKEFASNGVVEQMTVVVDVEKGRSILGPLIENNKLDENSTKPSEMIQKTLLYKTDEYQTKNCLLPDKNQKISLKRPHDENHQLDVAKKLKPDDSTKTCAINPECDHTQIDYTQVIFDADETADANDPKWSEFNNNFSIEEHFESVRKQWRSMAMPNPHKNLTTRFVPEHLKPKSETSETPVNAANENACMSCVNYLDNKINRYTQKVNSLYVKLNYLPHSNRGRHQRNKLLNEIDELQKFVIEIVKNREEIQQNFKFYQNSNNTWNANYLTRTELDELKEQEKLLEFQKRFYSR